MYYDIEANLINWEISKGEIKYAKRFGSFIIHFSKAGKPILLEILEATNFIGQFEKTINIKNIKKIQQQVIPA